MALIQVELKDRSYPIVVVRKDRGELRKLVSASISGKRTFVIADAQFWALHGRNLLKSLDGKATVDLLTIPVSEKLKSQGTVAQIQDYLLVKKISRGDLIIACGGGITSDLVGYVASTILRGVKWGVVTTTLMGMVDAAIGGKTGINHRSGKNLIGSIWQPGFVYANIEYLQTLSKREMRSGLGEILKYAGLVGGTYLNEVEGYLAGADMYDPKSLYRLVTSSAAFKAQIVCQDEREANVRTYLNLGHTFGHAIELSTGYARLTHGEAVILGLLAALELGKLVNPAQNSESKRYRALVEQGVRLVPKTKLSSSEIFAAMSHDKKRDTSGLRFVLLKKPGKPILCSNLPAAQIKAAIHHMLTVHSKIGGTNAPNSHC